MTIRRQNNKARLIYKPLEDRRMLAPLVVDTIDDVVSRTDGVTSLREAITLANSSDGSVSAITFDNSLSGQTVSLGTTLPLITADITIDGDLDDDLVADITIQGTDLVGDDFRPGVFSVREADVLFDGLTFAGLSNANETVTSAIDALDSSVSVINSNFDGNNFGSDNSSRSYSGGINSTRSDIVVDNTSFSNNFGSDAGAIHSIGSNLNVAGETLTVLNSTFEGNSGNSDALSITDRGTGAIRHTSGGDVFVDNSLFANNSGGGVGGIELSNNMQNIRVRNPRSATISNSVITENEGGSSGGVNVLDYATEVINSTISANVAGGAGGGLSFFAQPSNTFFSSLTVVNSTIADNTSSNTGGGVAGGGTFINSTITGNYAVSGGAISASLFGLSLENSIVLGNAAESRPGTPGREITGPFFGSVDFKGRNILGTNSDSIAPSSSVIFADPTDVFAETVPNIGDASILAGVLADNGGAVQTVALLANLNNPALDVGGLPVGLTTDATGNERSFDQNGVDNGGTVDAGAFELQIQVDLPPVIDDGATVTVDVPENTVFVTDVNVTDGIDSEGDGITFAITGGADAAAFTIDADTGELQFINAPDFEALSSSDTSNTFVVEVTATDSGNLTASQTVTVNVTDELPALALTIDQTSILENGGSTTATVTRSGDTSGELTVALTLSDDTESPEVTTPATVVFVDGQTEVTFAVTAVNDDLVDGDQVATITATAGAITATATVTVLDDDVPPTDDPLVLGTDGDDTLTGGDGDDILVGGTGSDVLIGSAGDDIFFTDQIDGDFDGNDRDVIDLGNLDDNATGNDVVRDFDVNGTNGGENNFDTLEFTFMDELFTLSSGNDLLDFIDFIETDGDSSTDAIQDGSDLIFVFGRDSENPDIITQSVRLEDVIGGSNLTNADLASSRVNQFGTFESDFFAVNGSILVGDGSNGSLNGGASDDFLVGGSGSDVLVGGAGNDILTGDETDGGSGGQDQDTFVFGDIDQLDIGNDVITDFDTNNFRGGESNFDTATFTFGGQNFSLNTGISFIRLIRALRDDGNADSEAILDGDDILLVFSRDQNGAVTESIRFQDIVGDDGLTTRRLNRNNIGQITNETV